MDVIVSIWLLVGFILCCFAAIGKLGHVTRRRTEHPINPEPRQNYQTNLLDTSIRPDNLEFVTPGEATNHRITDNIQFMIEYVDRDGVITERVIEPLNIYRIAGKATIYIDAFCTVRNAMRSFRNDRILSARDMQNNQEIANLGRYLWERY